MIGMTNNLSRFAVELNIVTDVEECQSSWGACSHIPIAQAISQGKDDGRVDLYHGELVLYDENSRSTSPGSVFVDCNCGLDVRFEIPEPNAIIMGDDPVIEIPTWNASSRALVTSMKFTVGTEGGHIDPYHGFVKGLIESGVDEKVAQIRFSLFGFCDYIGENVIYRLPGEGFGQYGNRISFLMDNWKITLEQLPNVSQRKRIARDNNRAVITHVGVLQKWSTERNRETMFTMSDARLALEALTMLFSFVSGHRTPCAFPIGYCFSTAGVARTVAPYKLDVRRNYSSWFAETKPSDCLSIAGEFYSLWRDADQKRWLNRVISIFCEANKDGFGTDARLVISQAALEMLAWDSVHVRKKAISGTAFLQLSAADKIRLALLVSNVPVGLPGQLTELHKIRGILTDANNDWDGAIAITQLRNAIVHCSQDKLKKLEQHSGAYWEALQLSQYFCSLLILHRLNYGGPYRSDYFDENRVWDIVPWAK